ncbi:hypothetical protein GWK47_044193 [Chionoecetes opilio]|uniref:Uncharacterized protein n=1 Tax=Chionoecetes opilio TaxID=41210 RepID=A0A8J5CY84_CHIOP|nr:hypothetical protein GWK47_044193 [Chionoecetes opilio]
MGESVWQGQKPRESWFKHFKDVWSDLTTDNPTTLSIRQKWLNKKKKECKKILQEILRSEKPPRADYREMAELTLIVLGVKPPRGIHWSRPGAIHQGPVDGQKPVFYEDVMFADSWSTMKKLFEAGTPQPLLGLFYTPMWMSLYTCCRCSSKDLGVHEGHMKFKRTDPEIAQAVLQKLGKPQVVPDTGGCAVRSLR